MPPGLVSRASPNLFRSADRFQHMRILKAIGVAERIGAGSRDYSRAVIP